MLCTDKIYDAFSAICEEAEKLKGQGVSDEVSSGLATIISIAKHSERHPWRGQGELHGPRPIKRLTIVGNTI